MEFDERYFAFEIADIGEVFVDAGETETGNGINLAETVEDGQANPLTGNGAAKSPGFLADPVDNRLEQFGIHRAPLGRRNDATQDLRPIERLSTAGTLDNLNRG